MFATRNEPTSEVTKARPDDQAQDDPRYRPDPLAAPPVGDVVHEIPQPQRLIVDDIELPAGRGVLEGRHVGDGEIVDVHAAPVVGARSVHRRRRRRRAIRPGARGALPAVRSPKASSRLCRQPRKAAGEAPRFSDMGDPNGRTTSCSRAPVARGPRGRPRLARPNNRMAWAKPGRARRPASLPPGALCRIRQLVHAPEAASTLVVVTLPEARLAHNQRDAAACAAPDTRGRCPGRTCTGFVDGYSPLQVWVPDLAVVRFMCVSHSGKKGIVNIIWDVPIRSIGLTSTTPMSSTRPGRLMPASMASRPGHRRRLPAVGPVADVAPGRGSDDEDSSGVKTAASASSEHRLGAVLRRLRDPPGAEVEDEPGHLPRIAGIPLEPVPATVVPFISAIGGITSTGRGLEDGNGRHGSAAASRPEPFGEPGETAPGHPAVAPSPRAPAAAWRRAKCRRARPRAPSRG